MAAVANLPQGDVEENSSDNAGRVLSSRLDSKTLATASSLTPCSVKCCLFSFFMCWCLLVALTIKTKNR